MKTTALVAAFIGLAAGAPLVAGTATVKGTYVEARTSEVFAGACVINSEVDTAGREALLAWKVDKGTFNGVRLDGLAVVAAIAGDKNLSVHEIGGETAKARAALFVDERATDAQRRALVSMVTTLSKGLASTVVEATPAAIEFTDGMHDIRVATKNVRLEVQKHLDHDASCGNKQWFQPLATVDQADLGATAENAFGGRSLGITWSDPNKRSGFVGTFSY
jgi:hypothetical protein